MFRVTWRRRLRSWWCVIVNGRHELYQAHDDEHLFQQCVLCGHITHGWDLTPKGKERA